MFESLMGNSVWQLVSQSDSLSKFVLFTLLAMSILCWTIFLYKWMVFRIQRSHLHKVLAQLQAVKTLEGLSAISSAYAGTLPGIFLTHSLTTMNTIVELRGQRSEREARDVQEAVMQSLDSFLVDQESYLPVLSTCAAVAPLLGLFGTVWGLIHSFIRISEKQAADITVVAPGIAEALITTLAGLIVAIPALIMYNYLTMRVRHMEGHLVQIADKVAFIVHHAFRVR